jgi:hypothetical protein
LLVNKKNYTI